MQLQSNKCNLRTIIRPRTAVYASRPMAGSERNKLQKAGKEASNETNPDLSTTYKVISGLMAAQFVSSLAYQPEITALLGLDPRFVLIPVLAFPPLGISSALALASKEEDEMDGITFVRLNLGLLTWQAGSIIIWLSQSAAVPLPECLPLWIAKISVAIPTIATSLIALLSPLAALTLSNRSIVSRPLPLLLLRLVYDDLVESLSLLKRKTITSRYLSFSQILSIGVGGSFAFSPRAPIPLALNPEQVNEQVNGAAEVVSSLNETLGLHLYRTGFGIELLFLLGVVQWVLASAEDEERAGGATQRKLNVGAFLTTLLISGSTVIGLATSTTPASADNVDMDLLPNIVAAGILGVSVSLVYLSRAILAPEVAEKNT
jgi:hypothetical protein